MLSISFSEEASPAAKREPFTSELHNLSLLEYALAVPGELDFFTAVLDKTDRLPDNMGYYLTYALNCWHSDSDKKLKLLIGKFKDSQLTAIQALWTKDTDNLGRNLFLRAAAIGRFSWIYAMVGWLSRDSLCASIPDLDPAFERGPGCGPSRVNALDLALRRAQEGVLLSSDYLGETLLNTKVCNAIATVSFFKDLGLTPLQETTTKAIPRWLDSDVQTSLDKLAMLEKQTQVRMKEHTLMTSRYEGEIKKLQDCCAALSVERELVSSGDQKQIKKLQREVADKGKLLTHTQTELTQAHEALEKEKAIQEQQKQKIGELEEELIKTKKELVELVQKEKEKHQALLNYDKENKVFREIIQSLRGEINLLKQQIENLNKKLSVAGVPPIPRAQSRFAFAQSETVTDEAASGAGGDVFGNFS